MTDEKSLEATASQSPVVNSLLDWSFLDSSYEKERVRREAEENAERLQSILAESTAADVGNLRLALAKIVAADHQTRSFGGNCGCAGGRGCNGHVPETTKIARAALGLAALPDKARVPRPPEEPKPKRKKVAAKKKAAKS